MRNRFCCFSVMALVFATIGAIRDASADDPADCYDKCDPAVIWSTGQANFCGTWAADENGHGYCQTSTGVAFCVTYNSVADPGLGCYVDFNSMTGNTCQGDKVS